MELWNFNRLWKHIDKIRSSQDLIRKNSCIELSFPRGRSSSFFFYQGFLSQTIATHRAAREGREPSFISLYHLQPLTNIQTFICHFACEITITYFSSHRLYLPDFYSTRFTTLSNYYLIDWSCDVGFCLFTCWIASSF